MAVTRLLHVPGSYFELSSTDFDDQLQLNYVGKIIVLFYQGFAPESWLQGSSLFCGPNMAAIDVDSLTPIQQTHLLIQIPFTATYEDGEITSHSTEIGTADVIDYGLRVSFSF